MDSRYKELSDRAFKLHKNNNLKEAEEIYTLLLQINPNDINILNLYGLLCISQKKYVEAIKYLTKAVIFRPNAYISGNLAKAYFEAGIFDKAIILFERIAKEAPSDDIYYSLGLSYKQIKNYNKSINAYKMALNLNPNHFSALYNLANTYKELNKDSEAKEYALKAIAINPNDESVNSLISEIYSSEKNYNEAIEALKKCILVNNKEYLYFYNIAIYYSKIDKKEEAEKNYLDALKLNPNHVSSLVNLASLYKENNKNESLKLLEKAYKISSNEETLCLSLAQVYRDLYKNSKSKTIIKKLLMNNPNCADAYMILGTNYMDEGKYRTALKNYEKALQISPNNLNFQHCKATALKYMGKIDEAERLFKKIVKNPNSPLQSKLTLAMIYLQKKEFEKGMKLYGQRYLETTMPEHLKEKIWTKNSKLENKNVLIYSNCGLGDTIMYSRYIPYLKAICKNIAIQTDKELVEILKYNYKNVKIFTKSVQSDNYDTILQIMDSNYALNMDFNNIPFSEGYLTADNNKIKQYKKLNIFKTNKLKIGIFYQGSKNVFRNRAIPYKYINELTKLKNIQLYSFQIENNENETDNIINLKDYINDYSDTAALLKCIDMLITIDSSIVHMAGALGVKTKLFLPKVAEWRWFNDKKTTPWYKSVEIVRQKKAFDWSKEIENLKSELDEYKK